MSDEGSVPPPSQGPTNPFQGLNVDKVKNAGLPIQLMLGGAVVVFIFGFFDWASAEVNGHEFFSDNAFNNFRGTFAWLLMIAVGVLAVLILLRGANRNFVYASIACAGLSVLLILWFWNYVSDSGSVGTISAESGASFGLYISLLAAIAATAGGVMKLLEIQKA